MAKSPKKSVILHAMESPKTGQCACGESGYELSLEPLVTHVCHCLDCQRLSGAAFAVSLWMEESGVKHLSGALLEHHHKNGSSGKGQVLSSCASCGTPLWTRYLASPAGSLFVRVGTLNDTSWVQPDVHIFTRSKQSWLSLPTAEDSGIPQFEAFYRLSEVWAPESLERLSLLRKSGGSGR